MTTPIYANKNSLEYRTSKFFINAEKTHHGKYDLSKVKYIKNSLKVIFGCTKHGEFKLTPANFINGVGCKYCSYENQAYTTEEFINRATFVHGDKFNYKLVDYINGSTPINIKCNKNHPIFTPTPHNHLNGAGCPTCALIQQSIDQRSNTQEFIEKAKLVHGDYYDYSKVIYIGSDIRVIIICPIHGEFKVTPNNHLRGQNCLKCSSYKPYSIKAINWLNSLNNTNIQHAENGGEFRIDKLDGSYYKADGYDPLTNTVYEFHGDIWHGNPDLFESEEHCHPYNKEITAKELCDKTIEREEEIKSLGYNLVVMWENDY